MAGSIQRHRFAVLLLPLVVVAMSGLARAATITVQSLADSGPGTLRQAILDHSSGDTINFSVTGTIHLDSELPTITDTLTITGPGGAVGITIDGGGTVQLMQEDGAALTLQFLTLAHGTVTDGGLGGAILNNADLTVTNCTFSGNQSIGGTGGDGLGGAIYNSGAGTLTIGNSTFSNNDAIGGAGTLGGDGQGGAIFNISSGAVTITNTTFSGNQATGGAGSSAEGGQGEGGAVYVEEGTLTITNSSFSGSVATGGQGDGGGSALGGAIFSTDVSTLTVNTSTFSDNQATGGASTGSADGGQSGGGAIFSFSGIPATVTNSTFSGNQANGGTSGAGVGGAGDGGAIFDDQGTLNITNSTYSGNQATGGTGLVGGDGLGGGIFNVASFLIITNTTFSGNHAIGVTSLGGAIYNESFSVKLKGTILAASTPGNCAGEPVTDVGYNISDDSSCGFGSTSKNSNTMLNLGTLLNNGGPTKTIALGSGSSAIGFDTDCTDQQATPQPVRTDQRLFIRPDSPSFCDSGAYEHDGVPPIVLDTSSEKVQIARSSSPDSDEVNMAFTFTDNGDGTCNAGNDALNGVTVGLLQGTCADLPTLGLELDLAPIVARTIGDQSYGTFFGDLSPSGTVSARIVQLGLVDDAPCGRWTLDIEAAGISSATYGLTGGSGPGTTYALTIQDQDGNEGCFDIDNAIVGNQIPTPTRTARRGVRR